ncbi:MAG: hypothetical protein ACXWP5_07800, partial [Bdellovibrionota bacterium]
DSRHQEKVTMKSIVRVESDLPAIPGAQMLGAPQAAPQQPLQQMAPQQAAAPQSQSPYQVEQNQLPKNFIAFEKGKGSGNLDHAGVNPEIAEAIKKFQAQQQADRVGTSQAAPEDRGFPSGLGDPQQQMSAPAAPEQGRALGAQAASGWKRPEVQLDAKKQFMMEKGGEIK